MTFTAALLSRMGLDSERIKRRILLSGDILTGNLVLSNGMIERQEYSNIDEVPVRSRSRLNIAKALFITRDYIDYVDPKRGQIRALGQLILPRSGGPGCAVASQTFKNTFAVKRSISNGSVWCFWKGQLEPAKLLDTSPVAVKFITAAELGNKGQIDDSKKTNMPIDIPLSSISEFILSDKNMSNNM